MTRLMNTFLSIKSILMKEFMFLVKAKGNPVAELSFKEQQNHVVKVGNFIRQLAEDGILKSAQPFEMEGVLLTSKAGGFIESELESEETIAGYYHIEAEDMNAALVIAKSDPRFEDSDWSMEIRQVMTREGINT
jgi:hypothetical protein